MRKPVEIRSLESTRPTSGATISITVSWITPLGTNRNPMVCTSTPRSCWSMAGTSTSGVKLIRENVMVRSIATLRLRSRNTPQLMNGLRVVQAVGDEQVEGERPDQGPEHDLRRVEPVESLAAV